MENPARETGETFISLLNQWQEASEASQQFDNLCKAYLTHAKFAFVSVQFEEVVEWLDKCKEMAEEKKLVIYKQAAEREAQILLQHKDRIRAEIDKPISPQEQSKILQAYIREAMDALKKEGLM